MEFGDDYVAARLSVDIPEGTAQGIQEITQEVERFRVTMEATTRAEADMSRYLEQMTEASKAAAEAQSNLTQQLQLYMSMSSRMSGGAPSMGVPGGGAINPFDNTTAGMGGLVVPPGARPPSPTDVAYQVNRMPTDASREYLNMQQARGGVTAQDAISINPQSIGQMAQKIAEREKAQVDQARQTDGNVATPPSPDGPSLQERVQRASGLAGQVMNEMGPRGSAQGVGALAARGLQWAANRYSQQAPSRPQPPLDSTDTRPAGLPSEGEPGTGSPTREGVEPPQRESSGATDKASGGLGGIIGKVGGALTAALAVFGLVQKGGEMVQGWRNVGSMRGGGAGEGALVSARAKILAMNPFISQDQARQLYQAVMSEGYADASGSGADNVIDFMKHNLTTMNMSVADSAKALRATVVGNVRGDPESVAGAVGMLGKELDTIRTLSRQGVMSQPDYRAQTLGMQQSLMAQGASPDAAARSAMIATQVGSGDQVLKGQFGETGNEMASSPGGQMWLRAYGDVNVPSDVLPQATTAYLTDTGQLNTAEENALRKFAIQAHDQFDTGGEKGKINAVAFFQGWVRRVAANSAAASDRGKARALYEFLLQGQGVSKATQQVDAQGSLPFSGGEDRGPMEGGSPGAGPGRGSPESPTPGGGGGGSTQTAPGLEPRAPAPSAGGGSSSVTIELTPDAAKLLKILGPNPSRVTTTQDGANRGRSGAQVNSPGTG